MRAERRQMLAIMHQQPASEMSNIFLIGPLEKPIAERAVSLKRDLTRFGDCFFAKASSEREPQSCDNERRDISAGAGDSHV